MLGLYVLNIILIFLNLTSLEVIYYSTIYVNQIVSFKFKALSSILHP